MKALFRRRLLVFAILMSTLLVGCSSGAVVYVPTPLPPESNPQRYEHPSGAFNVVMPPNWSAYSQNLTNLATASFSPPDSRVPLVTVAVINMGDDIEIEELDEMRRTYQSQIRPDLGHYTEQDADAQGDGAWRMVGVRQTATGETETVNTFFERRGSLLGVTDVVIPADAHLVADLQTIINTIFLGDSDTVQLEPTTLNTLALAASTGLETINISTWTTDDGVFFVTGEVTNRGGTTVYDVPVKVTLSRQDGTEVVEAQDTVMGYGIVPGGFVPFSLRFGQGQPSDASAFSVAIGDIDPVESDDLQPDIISEPALVWTDAMENSANGTLYVIGRVSNTSDEPVRQPQAIVTIFDQAGRVIAAGFADADVDVLPAGESASFNIAVPEQGGEAVNYLVSVQALACDETCE